MMCASTCAFVLANTVETSLGTRWFAVVTGSTVVTTKKEIWMLDHRALAGTDDRAPARRKAWEALGKWVASRVSRQRGVHVPNFFHIQWKLVATDESGSKLRRPIFLLSDRFQENFHVRQKFPEKGMPPPAPGDDVNFYTLAIQHSEGLTKDQAFSSVRDMVFRFGEAASQGKELRLDLGAGYLVVTSDHEVTFDFSKSGNAGGSGDNIEREKLSHLDPMLNGRQRSSGGSQLSVGGSAVNGKGSGSHLGSAIGSSKLSAEEEAALYTDVDALDPETIARGGGGSQLSGASMRAADLEAPTKAQVSAALKLDPAAIGQQTVEELGAALGARAAALEAQLAAQRTETDAIEAQLRRVQVSEAGPEAARKQAARVAEDIKAGRHVHYAKTPSALSSAKLTPLPEAGAAGSQGGSPGAPVDNGGLSITGSGSGGQAKNRGAAAAARSKIGGGNGVGEARSLQDVGPSLLSVGFASGGPGGAAHLEPVKRPPQGALPAPPKAEQPVPVIISRMSDAGSEGGRSRGSKVPVAPPLPPFRYARMEPNDAANKAWKQHAAPNAAIEHKVLPAAIGKRSVGGPAPPFLAVPPVVAAHGVAARTTRP